MTNWFGLTSVNQPSHREFGSATKKLASNAYGTGASSYLFDSIFKSGGRLKHRAASLMAADWDRPYSREIAAFPLATLKQMKYWQARVDDVYGERNLFCNCVPVSEYA